MEGMLFNLASRRGPAGMGQPNSEGRGAAVFHERTPGDNMAEPPESNSLELRIAFHNAVSRFQDWTADVAEPKVKLRGRFCTISEVCQEVANLSDPLPEAILSRQKPAKICSR